jgi:hypothetical protein
VHAPSRKTCGKIIYYTNISVPGSAVVKDEHDSMKSVGSGFQLVAVL